MRVDLTDTTNKQNPLPDTGQESFSALGGTSRQLANLVNNPALIVYGMIAPVALIAWGWLLLSAEGIASSNAGGSLGPSMQLLEPILRRMEISSNSGWVGYIVSICTPAAVDTVISVQSIGIMFLMWMVMAIAMMLPTAAPMLRTYAEIADTAARRGEPAVSLWVLAFGYLTIWFGFSLLATLFQTAILMLGGAVGASAPVIGVIGGLILIVAGIYQFTSLKNACLINCRNPFAIIFGQWSTRRQDIFKLGLQQGINCLGCCWALMLVMLSVGTMNLVWMGFLTIFTLLEKTGRGKTISRVFGMVLLAWGLFLVLNSANLNFS